MSEEEVCLGGGREFREEVKKDEFAKLGEVAGGEGEGGDLSRGELRGEEFGDEASDDRAGREREEEVMEEAEAEEGGNLRDVCDSEVPEGLEMERMGAESVLEADNDMLTFTPALCWRV